MNDISAFTMASSPEDMLRAYHQREERRATAEVVIEEARKMLFDDDFQDRLTLFMSDLLRLTTARADPSIHTLDQLPHHGLYFTEDETVELAKYTYLCDVRKTPQEILASFEEIFPSAKEDSLYLQWIRSQKPCIPGTLNGVWAKKRLTIRLHERSHEEALETEEREKEKRAQEVKKRAAQKKKEARKKRKPKGGQATK